MYPSEKNATFGIFVKNQVEAIKQRNIHVDVAAITDQRMGKLYVIKKYLKWLLINLFFLLFKGRKYDVVHAHYVFPSGLFGLWFKKLYRTKLVVTAHGGDIDKMARKGPFFFKQTKKILENADSIIAVGEKLKQDIVNDFEINEEKIALINMGVNRKVFKPVNKAEAKQELQLTKNDLHILFVGNKIKAKGLAELVDAYKKLKEKYSNLQLHIIGPNKEPRFLADLQNKVKEEEIDSIYFYPPIEQSEIALWMSAADIFVLPSYIEGFGLVALEAMSCHTPVVGSDVGGLSYLLRSGAGVLVEPKNADSLKAGIEKLIVSETLREQIVIQGEKVANENDEEKQINKLLAIYGQSSEILTE